MTGMHPDLVELVTRRLRELGSPGRPLSYRAASERAHEKGKPISPEQIRKIALNRHTGDLRDESVDGLAAALGVSRAEVLRAMHQQRTAPMVPWAPPDAASRLTFNQRRALDRLILAMVDERAETRIDHGDASVVYLAGHHGSKPDGHQVADGYDQETVSTVDGTVQAVSLGEFQATKEQVEANNLLLHELLAEIRNGVGRASK